MLVSFNPAITNNRYSQQTNKSKAMTFGENPLVDQKWLKKIIENPSVADNEYRCHFLNPHNNISKEQFIATVKESISRLGDGFKECLNDTIEWAQKFNRAS